MTTLSAAQIAQYASGAGFRGQALITMTAIALAESSGRTDVINSIGCVGLWQIRQSVHTEWTTAQLQDPATNAAAAYSISNGGTNFEPWQTYTNGMYLAEMGAAQLGASGVTQGAAGQNSATPASWQSDLGSALDGAAGAAAGGLSLSIPGLSSISGIFSLFTSGAAWVSNGHNWVRIVEVLGGGVAVIVGLKMLADSGAPSPVVTVAHGADTAVQHTEHAAGKVAELGASA